MDQPINNRTLRKARVTKINDYTPLFRELILDCDWPSEFEFKAGQFVMLHVPKPSAPIETQTATETSADLQPAKVKPILRAYSVASSDLVKNQFRLVFKAVEGGLATQYVWSLETGSQITFTGPFGKVLFREPPTEQLIFLNTGSGISQHFSFIESNAKKYPHVKYHILFGLRYEGDVYYRHELERLKSLTANIHYEFVLSRPSEKWSGLKGYVQNHIERFDYLKIPTTFYLCGNGAMIKDVKATLLEQGFDMTRVLAEAFD